MKVMQRTTLAIALTLLTSVHALRADDTDYYQRAREKYKKGDLDGALADYQKAVELKPADADGYIGRADVRGDKGDFAGAMADYARAIELKPDSARAYYNRGFTKRDQGDTDGALADFNKAIRCRRVPIKRSDQAWHRTTTEGLSQSGRLQQ